MIEIVAIRDLNSSFSLNTVIVCKRDVKICFSINYWKQNQQPVTDAYGIPRKDNTLHLLAGAKYILSLDLKSGYWLMEIKEADKAKTVFQVGTLGFCDCNQIHFGLCIATVMFLSLMESCMENLICMIASYT